MRVHPAKRYNPGGINVGFFLLFRSVFYDAFEFYILPNKLDKGPGISGCSCSNPAVNDQCDLGKEYTMAAQINSSE